MTVERWRQVALGLMVLAGGVGLILKWHDTPLIVVLVAAVGMLLTGRQLGPGTISEVVQRARSDYEIHANDVDMRWGTVNPKTLFFN